MLDFEKAIESEKQRPRIQRGSCILAEPKFATIVEQAILHKRGEKHLAHAWCVVQNHVHIVVSTSPGLAINDWLGSVKKFSARRINLARDMTGALWERESFSHLLRSEKCFVRACEYVEMNPVEARLCSNSSEWRFSSAHPGSFRDPLETFVPPDQTPFVEPRSRGELTHIIKEQGTYFVTFRLLESVVINEK